MANYQKFVDVVFTPPPASKADMVSKLPAGGQKVQGQLDSLLAKTDGDMLKAQQEVINNPEYYRGLLYGGTQKGRPGADKVPWEHPVFKSGDYEKQHLQSLMSNTDNAKKATQVTGTVAGVATVATLTTEDVEAGALQNILSSTVKRTAVDTGAKAADFSLNQRDHQEAKDQVALADAMANMSQDEKMVYDENVTFKGITDSERIRFQAMEDAEGYTSLGAAWQSNTLNTWNGLLTSKVGESKMDREWVLRDRELWYKEEKLAMDPNLRVWWEDKSNTKPTTYEDTMAMMKDYEMYKALLARTYHKPGASGVVEGLYNDIVTSFASPQEAALMLATFGYSTFTKIPKTGQKIQKAYELNLQRSKLNKQIRRYGGSALLSSAFALSAEEMRQTFLGIDLQNKDTMLMFGAIFGVGLKGLGDAVPYISNKIKGMSKAEQQIMLDEVAAQIRARQAQNTLTITNEPVGTPVLSVPASPNNPSPIIRLYDLGDPNVYNVINKIGKSNNTLIDNKGNAVAQGETAQEIYKRKYVGAHNVLISDMTHNASELGLTLDQYTKAITQPFDSRSVILRERKADLEVLQGRIIGAKESIAKATAEKDAKALLTAKEVLKNAEAQIKDMGPVPKIDTGTPEVDNGIQAMENFFDFHNVENYKLRLRDLQVKQKESLDLYNTKQDSKTVKLEETLALDKLLLVNKQAAAKLNAKNNAPETLEALVVKQQKELDSLNKKEVKRRTGNEERLKAKKEAFAKKQEGEVTKLEASFKDNHLGYFPRYFNSSAFTYQQTLAQKVAEKTRRTLKREPSEKDFVNLNKKHKATLRKQLILGLQNSPTARSLQKYDPEGYTAYMDDVEGTVDNMIDNVSLAKTENELRDLTTTSATGQGDKLRGKSDIGRRIDADESFLREYTHSDWATVTQAYSYDMGHKLSMRETLGVTAMTEFTEKFVNPILSSIGKSGKYTERQLSEITANLETVFQTGIGTRALRKRDGDTQDYLRAMMAGTNAIFSSGFGVATLPEAGPVALAGGNEIWKQTLPMLKQVLRDYSIRGYDENTADFFKGVGIAGNIQNSVIEARVADGTFHAFNQSATIAQKFEQGARKVSNVGYHAGGFHAVTSFFKYSAAGGFQVKVHRLGQKLLDGGSLGKGNLKYFSRQGLTLDDMKLIAKQPLKDKDGNPNYRMDGWDPTVRKKTITAMQRASDEAVLEPSALDLPRITSRGDSKSAAFNTFFQYSRFPLAAYNVLVRNGYDDADAKHVASLAVGSAIAVAVLLGREEYAVSIGAMKESERTYYDTRGNLNEKKLFADMTTKLGQFSMLGKTLDLGSATFDVENPLTEFTASPSSAMQGPSFSILGKTQDILNRKPRTAYSDLLRFIPVLGNHPLTKPILKDW